MVVCDIASPIELIDQKAQKFGMHSRSKKFGEVAESEEDERGQVELGVKAAGLGTCSQSGRTANTRSVVNLVAKMIRIKT